VGDGRQGRGGGKGFHIGPSPDVKRTAVATVGLLGIGSSGGHFSPENARSGVAAMVTLPF
jgi:hypothetical protein